MEKSKGFPGADMSRLILFYRLMLRPLLHEPVRASLTVLAVALGVAVVLAIDLAGSAAAGSFRASMETLVEALVPGMPGPASTSNWPFSG